MKKVYIILPTYNDWKSLNKVLKILDFNLKKQNKEIYIIVVNDGSSSKFKKIQKFQSFRLETIYNKKILKNLVMSKNFTKKVFPISYSNV